MSDGKLPAFQFYPADWRKDPGVQALSFHERGVWFEMLCIMHESESRGKLLLNGKAMPIDALARTLGILKQDLEIVLNKLLEYGVASKNTSTGVIFSRRMVKDERIRNIRRKCGEMGGNPNLVKQKPTTRVKQKPTPSSSSSSSNLKEPLTPPSGDLAMPSGSTPRQRKTNPRAMGTNTRAMGNNPRQRELKAREALEKQKMQKLMQKPPEEELVDAEFLKTHSFVKQRTELSHVH